MKKFTTIFILIFVATQHKNANGNSKIQIDIMRINSLFSWKLIQTVWVSLIVQSDNTRTLNTHSLRSFLSIDKKSLTNWKGVNLPKIQVRIISPFYLQKYMSAQYRYDLTIHLLWMFYSSISFMSTTFHFEHVGWLADRSNCRSVTSDKYFG